jgi:DNA topoisomerase-1
MKCVVCGRKAEGRFCELHYEAYRNLVKGYEAWKKAMRFLWKEYLASIQNNEFAGLWVKEVARYLLSSGHLEEPNSKNGFSVDKI